MPEPYITCIVTIHGIGFQHAPEAGGQGYADGLHERLRAHLPHELSGDPVSEFGRWRSCRSNRSSTSRHDRKRPGSVSREPAQVSADQ